MFRSLAHRNYRIWFVGALVSNVGAWMQATAQNWVVLTELSDNDALAVGITMALQFAPQFILVPITGLIADRFDRRKILIATQSALGILALALGALLILGHAQLWHLYVFALLLGIVNAVDNPARQTFVADLVSGSDMSNAVALNSASFNTARMIGPAVGGFLIVLVGSGWVFVINAVTFIAVIAALMALRKGVKRTARAPRQPGQLVAGFRYVWTRPDLLVVFVIVFLIGAFGMNFPIFSSTMAVEFGRGAGEYGILNSILAIGSLAGALMAARRERARMRVIILASGFFGLAALLSSVMPTYWTFAASTILIGFGSVTLLTTANGYVQTTTDPLLRGRVMALYMAILSGGTPLGAPIVGAVADGWGPRWGLGIAAVAGVLACIIGLGWLVFSRGMRVVRHPSRKWMPSVSYLEPPTAAIAVPVTAPAPIIVRAAPAGEAARVREAGAADAGAGSAGAEPAAPRRTADTGPITRRPLAEVTERAEAADVLPEDFSDEAALTSPIRLPKLPRREG
ncbi:MFS transporter [Agromyces archimandritae]|uniref:MFS transporter n=1 Tax=Agromyces archimandritae TaxID=2781962 RepID=A0A975FQG8_9MICO|nr:MFS transporter [Agromyces archimandritae]QTX06251.1 MFS transporter [Agromyces archimandritae]